MLSKSETLTMLNAVMYLGHQYKQALEQGYGPREANRIDWLQTEQSWLSHITSRASEHYAAETIVDTGDRHRSEYYD